jgi:hypothetical protein
MRTARLYQGGFSMAHNPTTPWWLKDADLGAMIEGRNDWEINNSVSSQGVDKVLGDIFNGMAAAFDPGAAGNEKRRYTMRRHRTHGCHSYQLNIANGKGVAKGGKEAARIALALLDFLRLIRGKLDAMQAFMSGKLRVSGDMLFAQTTQTMQPWLKRL